MRVAQPIVDLHFCQWSGHTFTSCLQSPEAAAHLPSSVSTIHNWIIDAYATQKEVVVQQLHAASRLVHKTLDGWTSCNNWALLGVISHSLRDSGIPGHMVLGLREIEGTHDGENLCSVLIQILSEYNIWSKIGYFMMDNASNNDTMLEAFSLHMEMLGIPFNVLHRRLRCIGHIINLSVRSLLFDNSTCAIQDGTYVEGAEDQLSLWREYGPLGKCHNICIYSWQSPQRIKEFKGLSGGILIRRDNDSRWNSWYSLLQSLLKPNVKRAVAQYTARLIEDLVEDRLTMTNWMILEELAAIFQNFI